MAYRIPLSDAKHDPASVLTVGTFDGVHKGHQAILRYLLQRATTLKGPSVVVSFDPHPREVVTGDDVPLLTTIEERSRVLEEMGVDRFIVIPFDRAFAALSAEAYVRDVLVGSIGMQEIVVGYDHGFGKGRSGDHTLLVRLGEHLGFRVEKIPPQIVAEHVVSSTEVRRQLSDMGDVQAASALLGRPYGLTALVVQGDGRGRTIGFPTANLLPTHPRKIIPRQGVYAVRCFRPKTGAWLGGMMNIGVRPTFEGGAERLEVHLFSFSGDLYGEELRVEFVERIRAERKFDGVEALVEQLYRDQARCKAALYVGP